MTNKTAKKRDTPWMFGENNPAKRPEVRKKLSESMMGRFAKEKNHKWKGGVSEAYKRKNDPEHQKAIKLRVYECEICGVEEEKLARKLSYDHCHKTGKFRGWLCSNCNRGIGLLKDDVELLKKAVKYIENAEQKISE